MAAKLLLCLTLLCLFSTIAISTSSEDPHSIASAPSSSVKNGYGSFNRLQSISSWFFRSFKLGFGGSRKLANGYPRERGMAELARSNRTRGELAPAPAPAPVPLVRTPTNFTRGADATKKKPHAVRWLLGVALGVATGGMSAVVVSIAFRAIQKYVKRPKPTHPLVFQRKIIDAKALAYLETAGVTDSLEELGRGGSGAVYKATLQNGRVVAIKKVLGFANVTNGGPVDPKLESSYDLTKNSAQIKAELDTLGQIRHRNLVMLLAYIPLPSAHLLVYDYMENGSLHDVLLKVSEGSLELPWETRFGIAQGVATGLNYLHCDGKQTIVHCDLKPGNILLDKDMVPHIGDFGLAKIIPDSFTHFTSENVAGTVGYMPPEYHQTCRYTTRGDVYGFGVVLIVLLTGKEPTNSLFSEVYTHMGNWLNDVLASGEQSAVNILDPKLRGHGNEREMLLALKVASFCLDEQPSNRPTSNDILKMLGQIKGNATPSPMIGIPVEALVHRKHRELLRRRRHHAHG